MSKSSHNWYCCKTCSISRAGAALDPQLDLWQTAKPFPVRWMDEQIGMKALLNNFKREAPQLAALLPALPRKLGELLSSNTGENLQRAYYALLREQRRQNWLLAMIALLLPLLVIVQ